MKTGSVQLLAGKKERKKTKEINTVRGESEYTYMYMYTSYGVAKAKHAECM